MVRIITASTYSELIPTVILIIFLYHFDYRSKACKVVLSACVAIGNFPGRELHSINVRILLNPRLNGLSNIQGESGLMTSKSKKSQNSTTEGASRVFADELWNTDIVIVLILVIKYI